MPADLFRKDPPEFQVPPEWLRSVEDVIRLKEAESGIAHRKYLILFLTSVYGFAIIATFTIFFLQGFRLISLDPKLLYWLGGATIGEIGGLAALVYGALFRFPRAPRTDKPARRKQMQSGA